MSSLASAFSGAAASLNQLLPSRETLRQRATGDSDYAEPLTLIFELRLPSGSDPGSAAGYTFLFPLQLAPQGMGISEPFAVDVTPTQHGGLFVEEGGIVQRRLRLRGTTGFWPAPLDIQAPPAGKPSAGASFSRQLPPLRDTNVLSGQRHFQWLQDAVFRRYGDYKRDPSTAAATQLILHDVQNDEHWLVAPMSFSSERSSSSPLEHPYDIDLLILDKADPLPPSRKTSERSLLQAMGDTLRATQDFLRRANAAVNDLTAVQQELSLAVHNVGATVGLASSLVGSVANFVAGTVELVQSPYQAIFAVAQACENVLRIAANARALGLTVANWPRPIEQRFWALTTAAEQLGLAPQAFVPPADSLRAQQAVTAAPNEAPAPLRSLAAIDAQGSSGMPSEPSLRAARTQMGLGLRDYPYTERYLVAAGDSLTSLAVRFLGDPRAWSVIAAANDMLPPFVPTAAAGALPRAFQGSALQVGQLLRIPSATPPAGVAQNDAVLGARPEQTPEEQTLGVDLLCVLDARGQRDLALGTTDGMPDLAVVAGEANFEQALRTRLSVERGTALLYPDLGLPRLVGTGQVSADWQQLRLRVQQVLEADPRAARVEHVEMSIQGDSATLQATVTRADAAGATQLSLAV